MSSPKGGPWNRIPSDQFKVKKQRFLSPKTKTVLLGSLAFSVFFSKLIYDVFLVPLGAPKVNIANMPSKEEKFKELKAKYAERENATLEKSKSE